MRKACSKLPYLSAVINETLRRYPTIVATLPRTGREEVVIQGVHVLTGVGPQVLMNKVIEIEKADADF